MMTIKIFCYIGAILFSTRVFLWIVCEVKKEDSYDGMNFAELKAEVNRLHQHHMQREKRR